MTEQKSNGVQQKLDELSPRKSIDTKPNVRLFASVEEAVEHIGFGWYNIWIVFRLGAVEVALVGIVVGALLFGWLTDRIGRQFPLQIGAVVGLLSAFGSSIAPSYGWLLAARFFVGVSLGGIPQVNTVMVEFVPTRQRAVMILTLQLFYGLGAAFSAAVALLTMPILGWRWMTFFCALPMIIFIIVAFLIPESVSYLEARGRTDDAVNQLQEMLDANLKHPQFWWSGSPPHADTGEVPPLERETYNVQLWPGRHKATDEEMGNLSSLLSRKYWLTTILIWVANSASNFTYIGVILLTTQLLQSAKRSASYKAICNTYGGNSSFAFNSTQCFQVCGLKPNDYADILWATSGELIAFIWPLLFVMFIGRRAMLSIFFLLFAFFTALLIWIWPRVVLIIFLILARSFNESVSSVLNVYTVEVYPTSIRGIGLGFSSVMGNLMQVPSPLFSQYLSQMYLMFSLTIYAGVGFVGALSTALLPIETRDRRITARVDEPDEDTALATSRRPSLLPPSGELSGPVNRPAPY